jgi:hypothetical protein
MKSINRVFAFSAAMLVSGAVLAGGSEVVTRSTADMDADLNRTYTSPGGQPAGQIKSRSKEEVYSDLIRDWDGRQTKSDGSVVGVESSAPAVNTRSTEDANKDLMRIWN